MSFPKSKKLQVIFVVLIGIVAFGLVTISFKPSTPEQKDQVLGEESETNQQKSILIDFNGDGVAETLNIEERDKRLSMQVFNSDGSKVADLWDGIALYPTTLYKVIKLNENSQKQYLQWDMAVGPHQVETVFLTIVGDKVHPIYSINFENDTMYTPFYTSRGSLVVEDAGYDGLKEIIENVDEYPENAPRLEDENIEDLIREQFSDEGLDFEVSEGMIEIVKRENYGKGRGKKVIMAIHSFVDAETPFFRRLPQDEYEKIAVPLVEASKEIAALPDSPPEGLEFDSFLIYSELSEDSRDFNDFVRDFWTHGRQFDFPMSDGTVN